jgi:hypothetical protein
LISAAWVALAVVPVVGGCYMDTSFVVLVLVRSAEWSRIRWTTADIYNRVQRMPAAESVAWIDRRKLTVVVH